MSVDSGCELAYRVLLWTLFSGPGDLKAGEVREHIRALFGPEVDAAMDSYIASQRNEAKP